MREDNNTREREMVREEALDCVQEGEPPRRAPASVGEGRRERITTLLCCLEALAVAAATLWSSDRNPVTARSSFDLLLCVIPVLLKPRSLFHLGNALVLCMFTISSSATIYSSK